MRNTIILVTFLVTFLVGCTVDLPDNGDDDGSGSGSGVTCEPTRTYTDLGGAVLGGDRPAVAAGADRMRLKPFTALSAEYRAALGLTAFDTTAYAATFGRPPARWYQEPAASANTIYAAYALAYDACARHTASGAAYTTAPDAQSADTRCRDFARRAWHREATDAEAATCVTFATTKTNASDSPQKRWAYTCASVLTASGFLAY